MKDLTLPESPSIRLGLYSALVGSLRGCTIELLTYPIQVVKVLQQSNQKSLTTTQRITNLYQEAGVGAFFRGCTPQLLKQLVKEAWGWPIMYCFPPLLKPYFVGELLPFAITGITVASIDIALLHPLERARLFAISGSPKKMFSYYKSKAGWSGALVHWTKLCVGRSTFLITQKTLRNHYQKEQKGAPLSKRHFFLIGLETSLVVSLVIAPFDFANTVRQLNANLFQDLQNPLAWKNIMVRIYRPWPLNFITLVIHNIASVWLFHHLERYQKRNE